MKISWWSPMENSISETCFLLCIPGHSEIHGHWPPILLWGWFCWPVSLLKRGVADWKLRRLPILKGSPSAPVLVRNDLHSCVSMKDVICLKKFSIRGSTSGRRNHLMGAIVPTPSSGNSYISCKQLYFPTPTQPHKTPQDSPSAPQDPTATPKRPQMSAQQPNISPHHAIPHKAQYPPPPL